jgi:hypothetical protein
LLSQLRQVSSATGYSCEIYIKTGTLSPTVVFPGISPIGCVFAPREIPILIYRLLVKLSQ